MYNVVILAGGLAKRMRPISENTPKSMIKIYGRPFIDYQLDLLVSQNIKNVVICIGNLGNLIVDHVGDGKKFGIKVNYSDDGKNLIGTGGAVKKAFPFLGENFFVLYGDSYLNINYSELYNTFKKSNLSSLMSIYKNNNKYDKSNVEVLNKNLIYYNKNIKNSKMTHIDYGVSILSKKLFNNFNDYTKFDLSDVFLMAAENKILSGFEVYKRFYEIGSFTGLKEFKDYLSSKGN